MRLRQAIRQTVVSGAGRLRTPTGSDHRTVILLYHSIGDDRRTASVSQHAFSQHLEWLTEHCNIVDYESIVDGSATTSAERPTVAITFDDGFEDNHRLALPVLAEHSVPATFFLTTGLIDGDSRVRDRFARLHEVNRSDIVGLTWSQVEELRDSGMTIGAHTVTHPNLAVLPPAAAEIEMRDSKSILEDRLGMPILHFAYPFGKPKHNTNESVALLAESVGFESGAVVLYRPVHGSDSRFQLPRFSVTGDDTTTLASKVRGEWDVLGLWQENAPQRLSAAASPARTFRSEASLMPDGPTSESTLPSRSPRSTNAKPVRLGIWPPFPVANLLGPRVGDRLPFPLDQPEARVYRRARQGLWHGVRSLGLGAGDEILTPTYHQGSEVEAFVQAGLTPVYYEIDAMLRPSPVDLEALITARTKALHLIHYWGFPQAAKQWRAWCDEHGLLLIEDGAQALLAETPDGPVGSFGHLAVFCLYKAFGLPDGAVAISDSELPIPDPTADIGLGAISKRVASGAAQRSHLMARAHGALGRSDTVRRQYGEFLPGELELGNPNTPAARLTNAMIPSVVDPNAAERRRANYRELSRQLGHLVPRGLADLPAGASPIAFPILSSNAAALQRRLLEHGVESGRLWPTWHSSLPSGPHDVADKYRQSVVAIPVHQELRPRDLEQLVTAVLAAPDLLMSESSDSP